jgi:hypothetical protein
MVWRSDQILKGLCTNSRLGLNAALALHSFGRDSPGALLIVYNYTLLVYFCQT